MRAKHTSPGSSDSFSFPPFILSLVPLLKASMSAGLHEQFLPDCNCLNPAPALTACSASGLVAYFLSFISSYLLINSSSEQPFSMANMEVSTPFTTTLPGMPTQPVRLRKFPELIGKDNFEECSQDFRMAAQYLELWDLFTGEETITNGTTQQSETYRQHRKKQQ
jgi:hypothetical protein